MSHPTHLTSEPRIYNWHYNCNSGSNLFLVWLTSTPSSVVVPLFAFQLIYMSLRILHLGQLWPHICRPFTFPCENHGLLVPWAGLALLQLDFTVLEMMGGAQTVASRQWSWQLNFGFGHRPLQALRGITQAIAILYAESHHHHCMLLGHMENQEKAIEEVNNAKIKHKFQQSRLSEFASDG